jgi:hypothetical protein
MSIRVRTLVLAFAIAVAVASVGVALFTSVDSVSSGGRDCGSPIKPRSAAGGCATELGHARATRTAALTWAVVALGAGWAASAESSLAGIDSSWKRPRSEIGSASHSLLPRRTVREHLIGKRCGA